MALLVEATHLPDELLDLLEVGAHQLVRHGSSIEHDEGGYVGFLVAFVCLGRLGVTLSVNGEEQHAFTDEVTQVLQVHAHISAHGTIGIREVNHDGDALVCLHALLLVELVVQLIERVDVRPVVFVLGSGGAGMALVTLALLAVFTVTAARRLVTAVTAVSATVARPAVVA